MTDPFKAIVRGEPSTETSTYKPHELMRDFYSRTNMSREEWADELTAIRGDKLEAEKIGKWLSVAEPPVAADRRVFTAFLRKVCFHRVADQWEQAFADCWARHSAVSGDASEVFKRHARWIRHRQEQNVLGEDFPLPRIYVPIQVLLDGVRDGFEETDKTYDQSFLEKFASRGLPKRFREHADKVNWLFIKGGPGSGKSALAQMLAHDLCGKRSLYTVFIRGTRLAGEQRIIDGDLPAMIRDDISAIDFIDRFRGTSRKTLVLIIDGLDEFGTSAVTNKKALDILTDIQRAAEQLVGDGKTVRIIAFGRDTVTRAIADAFRERSQMFEMGDLSGEVDHDGDYSFRYGPDLRGDWWNKFCLARGITTTDEIPDFLSSRAHSLHNLGREPLLAYLISKSSWPPMETANGQEVLEHINAHAANKNRNEIYADIINRVRSGDDWKDDVGERLPQSRFLAVLQYMALAAWQNGTLRAVSLKGIDLVIPDDETREDFRFLVRELGGNTPAALLTAFYYRYQRQYQETGIVASRSDYEIEFTHRTFAEYLLAIFLFDEFEKLLDCLERHVPVAEREAAQQRWLSVAMAGAQSREIASFALDEARLRLQRRCMTVWSKSKEAMEQVQHLATLADVESPWLEAVSNLERLNRATSAIFLFWGAVNRANFERTGEHSLYDGGAGSFEFYDFQMNTTPYSLGTSADSVADDPQPDTFSVHALSGVHWGGAELPGYYASGGDVANSVFQQCAFEPSTWTSVDFTDVEFDGCNFRRSRFHRFGFIRRQDKGSNYDQSSFNQGRIVEADYDDISAEQCSYIGVHFVNCNFREVLCDRSNFYDCSFTNCQFDETSFDNCMFAMTRFNRCTFIESPFVACDFEESDFNECDGVENK